MDDEQRALKLKIGKEQFLSFKKKKSVSSRHSSTLPSSSSSFQPLTPLTQEVLDLQPEVSSLRSEIADLRQHYEDEQAQFRKEIGILRGSSSPPPIVRPRSFNIP